MHPIYHYYRYAENTQASLSLKILLLEALYHPKMQSYAPSDQSRPRSNEGESSRQTNALPHLDSSGDNGTDEVPPNEAVNRAVVGVPGIALPHGTPGRETLHRILTSGYNQEEQLHQLEDARQ